MIAVLRVGMALSLYASGLFPPPDPRALPLWVYAALASLFTLVGLGLVLGQRNDPRAAWLGATLTLVASPLTTPLITGAAGGSWAWMVHVRPEAFLSCSFWEFVACFPTPLQGRAARFARGVSGAAAAVGVLLAGASLTALSDSTASWMVALRAVPDEPIVFFWPLAVVLCVPAFLVLLRRRRTADAATSRRVQLFVNALLLGLLPFTVQIVIEGMWEAYYDYVHSPQRAHWVGWLLFGTLATLPFTTAYSVLFDRVVAVRLVLQKALQYALAKYSIAAVTLVPFAGLAMFIAANRHEPIEVLVSGNWRPLILLALASAGLVMLRARTRLLAAVDRQYFRDPYDGSRVLERLMGASTPEPRDLARRVAQEVGAAFHSTVDVLLLDSTRSVFQHTESRQDPLSAMTPLLQDAGKDEVVDLDDSDHSSIVRRLPRHEQDWLARGGYKLIVPIRRPASGILGMIALRSKLSELPYSADDRRFLVLVAAAAAMVLDASLPRPRPEGQYEPPARVCSDCFSIHAAEAEHCLCGRAVTTAGVPYVLRGVFRFEQQVANGTTGAVYRAVDLSLGRYVAMKALPTVSEGHVQAIVQEARAMARVTHTNLAQVYGLERWRDTSFLVQEFLEQGTLAQRLSRTAFDVPSTLDLGLTLADVVGELHRADLIHCDIKPSNIGYTAAGVVKLFDFGLARTHQRAVAGEAEEGTGMALGTPFYMSPEAIQGLAPNPLFDLWALSVVLYEVLAGRRPFDGGTTTDVLAAVLSGQPPIPLSTFGFDPGLSAFFERALHRDPTRRPASATELREGLAHLRSSHRPAELAGGVFMSDARGN